MGSEQFRFIRSDGSRPGITVGGDIGAYQQCMIQYKDAWKQSEHLPAENEMVVDDAPKIATGILAQIKAVFLPGR